MRDELAQTYAVIAINHESDLGSLNVNFLAPPSCPAVTIEEPAKKASTSEFVIEIVISSGLV